MVRDAVEKTGAHQVSRESVDGCVSDFVDYEDSRYLDDLSIYNHTI